MKQNVRKEKRRGSSATFSTQRKAATAADGRERPGSRTGSIWKIETALGSEKGQVSWPLEGKSSIKMLCLSVWLHNNISGNNLFGLACVEMLDVPRRWVLQPCPLVPTQLGLIQLGFLGFPLHGTTWYQVYLEPGRLPGFQVSRDDPKVWRQ